MGKIKKLSDNIINMIAAGEVVERPASIVKELVENSVDAGATKIIIKVSRGGLGSISVSDDGTGMDEQDALLAFTQHATSKVFTTNDLENIHTLGFRGEALASISSVSEITLETKPETESATKISISQSSIQHDTSAKSTRGTTITIKNLFQNVPARQKFLKSESTEFGHILNTFLSLALVNTEIHLELHHNGNLVHRLPNTKQFTERVFEIWGSKVAENLYERELEQNGVELTAHIGSPDIARKDRKLQYTYVNGRKISDRMLQKALSEAFKGFIHRDLQPVYFLFLKMPSNQVDVNVHPRKAEVRFKDTNAVYRIVYNAVRTTLEKSTKQELINRIQSKPTEEPDWLLKDSAQSGMKLTGRVPTPGRKSGTVNQGLAFTKTLLKELPEQPINQTPPYNINPVQIFNTYIVYEKDNELVFIDQHAAAEKIQYERILENTNAAKSKPMLVPEIIELNQAEKKILLERHEQLSALGLEISDFGGNSVQITAIPETMNSFDAEGFIQEFLEETEIIDVERISGYDIKDNLEKNNPKLHTLIATIACHGSIRAGQRLNQAEMLQIIENLEKCQNPYNCPHGRPATWVMSKSEIEKNFKRTL